MSNNMLNDTIRIVGSSMEACIDYSIIRSYEKGTFTNKPRSRGNNVCAISIDSKECPGFKIKAIISGEFAELVNSYFVFKREHILPVEKIYDNSHLTEMVSFTGRVKEFRLKSKEIILDNIFTLNIIYSSKFYSGKIGFGNIT